MEIFELAVLDSLDGARLRQLESGGFLFEETGLKERLWWHSRLFVYLE